MSKFEDEKTKICYIVKDKKYDNFFLLLFSYLLNILTTLLFKQFLVIIVIIIIIIIKITIRPDDSFHNPLIFMNKFKFKQQKTSTQNNFFLMPQNFTFCCCNSNLVVPDTPLTKKLYLLVHTM